MNFFVTIEETISETFQIDANNPKEALELVIKKYKNSEFIVENGCVISKKIAIIDNNSDNTDWIEF